MNENKYYTFDVTKKLQRKKATRKQIVKIIKNGCNIFPNSSIIEVDRLEPPMKSVINEANGNNYLPKGVQVEKVTQEEYEEMILDKSLQFCTNCGQNHHDPKNWNEKQISSNYTSGSAMFNGLKSGTCQRCFNTLTK